MSTELLIPNAVNFPSLGYEPCRGWDVEADEVIAKLGQVIKDRWGFNEDRDQTTGSFALYFHQFPIYDQALLATITAKLQSMGWDAVEHTGSALVLRRIRDAAIIEAGGKEYRVALSAAPAQQQVREWAQAGVWVASGHRKAFIPAQAITAIRVPPHLLRDA